MNKILLAFAILSTGTAGLVSTRQSTIKLQREASATRESCGVETQVLTDAQSERARLVERIRELKQNLRQAEAADLHNGLWSVLETNRIGDLGPDLREQLLEELGFNWSSSEAFVVVSKEAVRQMGMHPITGLWPDGDDWHGRLSDSAAAVLALTPRERSQVEAAMERIREDLTDWTISHTERSEPHDDILAQYTLQSGPPTSITNKFMTEIFSAIGKERTELMETEMGSSTDPFGSIQKWISRLGNWGEDKPVTLTFRRDAAFWDIYLPGKGDGWGHPFPKAFHPLFPNGLADIAEREGFEIPKRPDKK